MYGGHQKGFIPLLFEQIVLFFDEEALSWWDHGKVKIDRFWKEK